MKVARYIGGGQIAIVDEPEPEMLPGGLIVGTEACGLCSGELMEWYMDRKVPHVLGHEVAGIVAESEDDRFPIGSRVFPHHHAPCLVCDVCARGLYVHCARWKRTKLEPGGMAQRFAVAAENLTDTLAVDDLRPIDAALIEPLACVVKALRTVAGTKIDIRESNDSGPSLFTIPHSPSDQSPATRHPSPTAVIGLGVMGLMHALLMPGCIAYEVNPRRIEWARKLGIDARIPGEAEPTGEIYVCPGNQSALDLAIKIAQPGGRILLFAPMPPDQETKMPLIDLYFKDIALLTSYSCGPDDTRIAADLLRAGKVCAEQVVSDFVGINELPKAYEAMKAGDILKAMVVFE